MQHVSQIYYDSLFKTTHNFSFQEMSNIRHFGLGFSIFLMSFVRQIGNFHLLTHVSLNYHYFLDYNVINSPQF